MTNESVPHASTEDAARSRAQARAGRIGRESANHPAIDFWVDVRLVESDGRWLAVADLASTPEIAAASRPDLAVLFALWP